MSKSKSRQPSKSAPNSNRSRSNAAKTTVAVNKAPVKSSASTATEEKGATTRQVPTPSAPTKPVPSTPTTNKALTRDAAKYERRQAERQTRALAQRRSRRNKMIAWISAVLVVLIIGTVAGIWIYRSHQPAAQAANVPPPFQEAVFDSNHPPVENVYCDQLEQSIEHIHVYLTMFINGQAVPLSPGVGLAQDSQSSAPTCYYWLHTHDSSGVIHIESPTSEPFTLGQFLGVWDQQFQSLNFPQELLLPSGWTIWINGKPYHGSVASIPLNAHSIITLAYNSPNAKPATTYNWGSL